MEMGKADPAKIEPLEIPGRAGVYLRTIKERGDQ
jgi:hypothetical protein